jgi:hypothetical protein
MAMVLEHPGCGLQFLPCTAELVRYTTNHGQGRLLGGGHASGIADLTFDLFGDALDYPFPEAGRYTGFRFLGERDSGV